MNKLRNKTLDKFLRAWESKDISAVLELLPERFEYYESPLDKPLNNKQDIAELWAPVPETEAEVKLDYKFLADTDEYGLFRITGEYMEGRRSKVLKKIDRIFLIDVDDEGKMCKFMQWREEKIS